MGMCYIYDIQTQIHMDSDSVFFVDSALSRG